MDLTPFGNAIGISDVLAWRECPARFAHSMRRHIELPPHLQVKPGERDEPPESTNWTNAYGSAIHHAIHLVDKEGYSHQRAIDECMQLYGVYLEVTDIPQLYEDLDLFERRRPLGVTLVASEADMRVPLFVHSNGTQYFFRFKLDVLHRLISNPSVFVHRDYKSSKWPKTAAEVHKDPQLWAYNFGIHEYYPECAHLLQTYDQLRYGEVNTTKNDEQRAQMKQWLIDEVTAIINDDTYAPKTNDFCRYCDLVVTCREPRRATRYTRGRLAVLAPMTKQGRKVKIEFAEEGDELERIIAEELPEFIRTRKHIEHLEKLLKGLIEQMPEEERERLGWHVTDRKSRTLPPDGLRALHDHMGDAFYSLISLSQTRLEDYAGKPKKGEPLSPVLEIVRNYQTEEIGGHNVVPAKSGE